MNNILPRHPFLNYVGRIDHTNPDAPVFYWAGSMVSFGFTGLTLHLQIENHSLCPNASVGYILDGKESKLMLSSTSAQPESYAIHVEGNGTHTFTLFKRMDGVHYFSLHGISLAKKCDLVPLHRDKKMLLEFIGDSITAGAVCEAVDNVGREDPPNYDYTYDNAWHSYAMQTARLLNADVHLVAQGGAAMLDGTGYFDNGNLGMETIYDKLCYLPNAPKMTPWDFSKYRPDFVIVAIGQNDHCIGGVENQIPTEAEEECWLASYTGMIERLMTVYPSARFILTLTLTKHDDYWERLLDKAAVLLASDRILRFRFTRSGKATSGHPRIPEQCEMACELAEYIRESVEEFIRDVSEKFGSRDSIWNTTWGSAYYPVGTGPRS